MTAECPSCKQNAETYEAGFPAKRVRFKMHLVPNESGGNFMCPMSHCPVPLEKVAPGEPDPRD